MDWSRSYPVAALGMSTAEVETVLALYTAPPFLVGPDELERVGDVFAVIGDVARARLHLWCLGVVDGVRTVPTCATPEG